jgi:hypothetical protein
LEVIPGEEFCDRVTIQTFAGELLTLIERREARLLGWGFYTVRHTIAEIERAIQDEAPASLRDAWEELSDQGESVPAFVQRLERAGLLFLVPGTSDAYRTRFAEGVRLTANLRQRFSDRDWASGPRLVSDIKIDLTPRTYPRRDRSSSAVWSTLNPYCQGPQRALLESCFEALTRGRDGRPLNFSGFQERAFAHIFQKYGEVGASGSVVSAGTGSGKTKAFYIPAFLRVASELSGAPFTKIIAIYPRNVLLADQLREAVSESLKLRPVLERAGLRPIRIGALLGTTPWNSWFSPPTGGQRRPDYHWARRGNGAIVPYLTSPEDGRSELIWRDSDRQENRTRLYREGQTTPDVPEGILSLTREQLIESPPDILFLSLEMLNREMGNPQWHRTFGIRQGAQAPRMLLLDEVHAYEGAHGAQVAWVLRRWRHWSQARSLHVVGLSATLANATEHVTRVAGLPAGQVVEFAPVPGTISPGEMESEGVEYNIAVKGDPGAGASLLSTSIQTGMLLTRLLTPRGQADSTPDEEIKPEVFYRRKVFGFSDNLDSINRWFSNMFDAESNLRLPRLRLPLDRRPPPSVPADVAQRMEVEGQLWNLPAQLGHDLSQPLVVTRCSSQDPGADVNSDMIIATSSLEVGFDDPNVGAMLHHKRPGSMASFIQRKGRAGRTRGSRPWTVVVLSDYGADRLAFQSAETLFRPEVASLFLPISNPFVLRVQAALFLVDWIGHRVGGSISPYQYLGKPRADSAAARQSAIRLLRGILELGQTWQQFRREFLRFYISYSGSKDPEFANSQIDDILWQEPRPLLTQAIPALLRKLETEWTRADGSGREDDGADRPMPKFIPRATFLDLDVSEAELRLENFRNIQREPASMPISQMLRESCPGKASKRFATVPNEPGYWHAFSPQLRAGANTASVRQLFPENILLDIVDGVRIYQPDAANLVHRPNPIADSSNSSWRWEKIGSGMGQAARLPVLLEAPWNEVFSDAQAFLHADNGWIELIRYARTCQYEIRTTQPPQQTRGRLTLESAIEDGSSIPEAVGFRIQADGLRFALRDEHLQASNTLSPQSIARLRPEYLVHCLKNSDALRDTINAFQADWLAQISVAMLTDYALRNSVTLEEAQADLMGSRRLAARQVLETIFQSRGVLASGQPADPRLKQILLDLWANPVVEQEVIRLEALLWQPLGSDFFGWARECYVATLAQAVRSAACAMSDQVTEEDLAVDVIRSEGHTSITVTELSSGGLGQIEAITREIKKNPRRFLDGLEYSLRTCARGEVAADLNTVANAAVEQARSSGNLSAAFSSWRNASGFAEQEDAARALRGAIEECGIVPRRQIAVGVAMKLLRPGTSTATDRLIVGLNRSWRRRSQRLGIQVPFRSFAYLAASFNPLRRRLDAIFLEAGATASPSDSQVYAQVQQLLHETCSDSCSECLDGSPFETDYRKPSKAIALEWLRLAVEEVEATSPGWLEQARTILRRSGRVIVLAPVQLGSFIGGLVEAVNQELDRGGLFIPVAVYEVQRGDGFTRVGLRTRDFANE